MTQAERRELIEKESDISLDKIANHCIENADKNIENMIGATQVPLGIAGPIKINGDHAKGEFFIPIATTEAALVATINRGCKAITKSGGTEVFVLKDAMTRGPCFALPSAKKAKEFVEWVEKNFSKIAEVTQEGSRHLKVKKIQPWIVGRNVFLRFECETGDAMGMNMVTIGVAKACRYAQERFKSARWIATSGNMCTDKKPSAINMIQGRGKTVIAEVVLSEKVVKEILKTTPEKMIDTSFRKHWIGSGQAGAYGFNTHFANMVAGLYIATGQDPAQVVSGSIGFTVCEKEGNGVHVSVTMPSIDVGSVGGGTKLGTQRQALEILGCAGGGNAKKLAEIVCATVLAGEISSLAALGGHDLAKAHKERAR